MFIQINKQKNTALCTISFYYKHETDTLAALVKLPALLHTTTVDKSECLRSLPFALSHK